MIECLCVQVKCYGNIVLVLGLGANMNMNMFEMWNTVNTKSEQTNVQQSQQPHTSGGSIKGNFHLIKRDRCLGQTLGQTLEPTHSFEGCTTVHTPSFTYLTH